MSWNGWCAVSARVIELPRRQDIRKSPRRLARKPKAPVIELRPTPKPSAKAQAYQLYLDGSAIDERDPVAGAALYERALELDPELAIAWTNLGNLRYNAKNVSGAIECYQRALELEPSQPEGHYNLGYVRLRVGWGHDREEGMRLLTRATELDPAFADAWYNLGMAYREQNQDAKAARCFARYVELEPTGEWSARARDMMAYHTGEARAHLRAIK